MKLIIEDIYKSFGQNNISKGSNHNFSNGKIYALLGRNGSGKTTLFDIISKRKSQILGNMFIEENGIKREIQQEDLFYMVANPLLPNFLTGREFLKFL